MRPPWRRAWAIPNCQTLPAAERPGLYCRVIQVGMLQTGANVSWQPATVTTIPLIEMFRDYYATGLSEKSLRRQLAAPISLRARQEIEAQLQKIIG